MGGKNVEKVSKTSENAPKTSEKLRRKWETCWKGKKCRKKNVGKKSNKKVE